MNEPPEESWLIDFFEEGETHENASPTEPSPPPTASYAPAPLAPRAPLLAGRTRALRLALGVVAVITLALVIIIVTSGGSEASADSAYLARIDPPAHDSQLVGAALGQALAGTPSSSSKLIATLRQLLGRQQQDLATISAISPPPKLRSEHEQAVSAMQFRVGGLTGLLTGFREAAAHPAGVDWASQLSIQADRLIASDVIWQVFFVSPADVQLAADGVRSQSAPGSTFVGDTNLTAPEAMASVLADLQGHAAASSSGAAPVLQLGDTSAAVKAWQEQLNEWIGQQPGLTKLPVTGTFDQATQSATMAFQTAEKITADGVVGPVTRSTLASALAKH